MSRRRARRNRRPRPRPRPRPRAAVAPLRRPREIESAVRARGPGDVVGALPHLMGFVPEQSLVLISLRGPRRRVGLVLRADLPEDPGHFDAVASQSLAMLQRDDPDAVFVVVCATEPWRGGEPGERPYEAVVDGIVDGCAERELDLVEAVYTDGARWWSYHCEHPSCCPAEGVPVEPAGVVATSLVAEGAAPLESREALARRLDPAGPLTVASVASHLRTLCLGLPRDLAVRDRDRSRAVDDWAVEHLALLRRLVEAFAAGRRELAATDAAEVLLALHDMPTRDAAMVLLSRQAADDLVATPPADPLSRQVADLVARVGRPSAPDGEDDPERVLADAAEELLCALVARAPGGHAAGPAALLALCSWNLGGGALARIAVERALAADPRYRLALLVEQLLDAGVPPPSARRRARADRALPPRMAG